MADASQSQTADEMEETDLTLVAYQYGSPLMCWRVIASSEEDAFDHFTMPVANSWRTNVPVVDEVEEMVRTSLGGNRNSAKFRNKLLKQLLDLVACLAWQEVAAHEQRTSSVACARLVATAVDGVITNYHIKIWAQEQLFVHFPEKNWPTDLLASIVELKAVLPKASWLAKAAHTELRSRSVQEQQTVLFGQHMWLRANDASVRSAHVAEGKRCETIHDLAPKPPLGARLRAAQRAHKDDFFATLMDQLWPGDCQRRASMSVMKSKARGNIEMTLAEKVAAVATARQKNINAREAEWGGCWRAPSFLAWLLAGMPCAEKGGTVMDTLAI
eukprot:CAMPEP_0173276448 /NCGR_PEP_ID=MMETSP1143-20121109/3528_1 /TAXON_ID=483371 /ORGANISM="non described non described, Strain CCMP2298" /LENGTH=328 /DNA_ID=CAMNT_0014213425 /DNA_START=9 /DNA_END=994 /DNA_ORIENTATION=+